MIDFPARQSSASGPPGYEDLTLAYNSSSDSYTLTDLAGDATRFDFVMTASQPQTGSQPQRIYKPGATWEASLDSSGVDPANPTRTTFAYDGSGNVTSAISASPGKDGNGAQINCSASSLPSSLPRGCRALTFTYAASTSSFAATTTCSSDGSLGDYPGRMKSVSLTTWDPTAGGSGAMSTSQVAQYCYDASGRLRATWDPRSLGGCVDSNGASTACQALKESYSYDATSGKLTSLTPTGQNSWSFTYKNVSSPSTDPEAGRLLAVSRMDPANGQATTTIAYHVAVSGSGAPYQLGASDIAAWAQQDAPVEATAVFAPDHVPASSPTLDDYAYATIHYLDDQGREVNAATAGGHIATTEYDGFGATPTPDHPTHDDVVRTLSAANRELALSYGATSADHAARAQQLDTQMTYNAAQTAAPADVPAGAELLGKLGPLHQVRLATGSLVNARQHTTISYDEDAPTAPSGTTYVYALPTTKTVAAAVAGSADADPRKTTYSYGGQSNLGWQLGQPTATTVDPGGLNLTTVTLYDSMTGAVTEQRLPGNTNGGDAHSTKTYYYEARTTNSDGTAADAACASQPELAGLPCERTPGGQPNTAGQPALTTTTYKYNTLGEPVSEAAANTSTTRTTTVTYDAAGRLQTTAVAVSSPGGMTQAAPLPTVTTSYDAATGIAVKQSASAGQILKSYDADGRLTTYTDASGNVATTSYDIDGRLLTKTDGKGTTSYGYDSHSGLLTSVTDSALGGPITAGYDADGNLVTEDFPNGLRQATSFDETGAPKELSYTKTTNCSSNCTWLDFTGQRSVHGDWLHLGGSLQTSDYSYDNAGRLKQSQNTPDGKGCTTHAYFYVGAAGLDSNRTSDTKIDPATDGSCQPNATDPSVLHTTSHSYDAADRLYGDGTTYDDLGRATFVPAADAGGHDLSLSYFANDMTQSVTQNGVTQSYTLDPAGRDLQMTSTGGDGQTHAFHYADDSDNPAWTTETSDGLRWTRDVAGPGGDLCAIQDSQSGVALQLTNLHGDVVATASLDPNASGPGKTYGPGDEFGVPNDATSPRYAWLGGKGRRTELDSGVIQMGSRTYVPALGRFTSVDPVPYGSANAYDYANQDPVDQVDLNGTDTVQGQAQLQGGPVCGFSGVAQRALSGGYVTTASLTLSGAFACTVPIERVTAIGYIGRHKFTLNKRSEALANPDGGVFALTVRNVLTSAPQEGFVLFTFQLSDGGIVITGPALFRAPRRLRHKRRVNLAI